LRAGGIRVETVISDGSPDFRAGGSAASFDALDAFAGFGGGALLATGFGGALLVAVAATGGIEGGGIEGGGGAGASPRGGGASVESVRAFVGSGGGGALAAGGIFDGRAFAGSGGTGTTVRSRTERTSGVGSSSFAGCRNARSSPRVANVRSVPPASTTVHLRSGAQTIATSSTVPQAAHRAAVRSPLFTSSRSAPHASQLVGTTVPVRLVVAGIEQDE
jgi:hypothetical protein